MTESVSERVQALRLVNDEIKGRIEAQWRAGERVETKSIFLAGFNATGLQILVARGGEQPWTGLAVVAFLLGISGSLWAVAIRKSRTVPLPGRITEVYERLVASGVENVEEQLLATLAATRAYAFDLNERVERARLRGWWIALGGLLFGAAVSIPAL